MSPLVRETTLYCDQAQPGRRFQYDDLRAVWFPGRETVEFFSADGEFPPHGGHSRQVRLRPRPRLETVGVYLRFGR